MVPHHLVKGDRVGQGVESTEGREECRKGKRRKVLKRKVWDWRLNLVVKNHLLLINYSGLIHSKHSCVDSQTFIIPVKHTHITHIYKHTYIHAYTHIYTHTHIHTYTHSLSPFSSLILLLSNSSHSPDPTQEPSPPRTCPNMA